MLAGFFSYVYQQKRQQYLLAWAVAWLLVGCYFIRPALGYSFDSIPWFSLDEWILSVAMLAFYCSARLYARLRIPAAGVALAAAIATIWSIAYVAGWVPVHLGLGVALGFFVVARTFWKEGSNEESRADQLLAFAFVSSGLLRLLIIFQSQISSLKNTNLIAFALLPEMFGGILMLMAVYEEERRRIERNMLALSNLNLATSSFSGGEIQKMLSQALDRVLNVVRIPAGAGLERGQAVLVHRDVILYANRQFASFVGVDRIELVGRRLGDLVPPEYAELVNDNIQRRLAGEGLGRKQLGHGTLYPREMT